MKTYKLRPGMGIIIEHNGIFTHHFPDGAKQLCTMKEVKFYGGVEETAEVSYEPVQLPEVAEKEEIIELAVEEVKEEELELSDEKPAKKPRRKLFDFDGDGDVDKDDFSIAAKALGSRRKKKK